MFGSSRPKSRFSLVLLDEGEYYLEDFSAFYYPTPQLSSSSNHFGTPQISDEEAFRKRVKGRMLLCSGSIFFDPEDNSIPIWKFKYSDITVIEHWIGPLESTLSSLAKSAVLLIRASQVIEMKENNVNAPYKFKKQNPPSDYRFTLPYTSLDLFLGQALSIFRLSRLPRAELDIMLKGMIQQREDLTLFNHSWLYDLNEKQLCEFRCQRITPLVRNPGRILVTNSRLYFQPMNNIEATPVSSWALGSIVRLAKRRHALRHVGVELFLEDGTSIFMAMQNTKERTSLYNLLSTQPAAVNLLQNDESNMVLKWQNGLVSNYDYLMYLNSRSGRTFNDLTQYPVFPWVIADYSSPVLDLTKKDTFRDLSKPIGALNPTRLQMFMERYEQIPDSQPKFLYGTHYSTPGYVLYYLVRQAPEFMLRLQNGRFDSADRMFHSIEETWLNVLNNPTDVKELIPEFYKTDVPFPGEFLINTEGLDLGTKQNGVRLNDVALPNWASSSRDFVLKMREALECERVSEMLNNWIDLIFGYRQRGEEAVKAANVFYHLTYEGAVDIENISDPVERESFEAQINEFGQTPRQLFDKPHPKRFPKAAWKVSPEKTSIEKEFSFLTFDEPSTDIDKKEEGSSTNGIVHEEAIETAPVQLWPLIDRLDQKFSIKLHRDSVSAVCLSSSGETLYSVSQDTSLKIYSVPEKKQQRSINLCGLALSSCQLAHDEQTIVVGSWDNSIYLYSVAYGRVAEKLTAHDDAVSCLRLVGDTLLSGSWDSTVKLWSITNGNVSKVPITDFVESETPIRSLDMDSMCRIAVSGSEDGSLVFSDIRMQHPIRTLQAHIEAVNGVKFSTDGNRVVTCSEDRHIKIIEVGVGAEIWGCDAGESLKCLSTDGNQLFVGGESGLVRKWDLASGEEDTEINLSVNRESVNCVCVGSDSNKGIILAAGSQNGTISVWSSP
eukprot:TRINITY_DN5758_c0_g1_i1.p1 TRINITY_DN5758_c0_g1~~TRINITY_DN5758_c0_g1_i1.p1  ORF type:complete len:946 (+),score=197.65 TRINITY_DN5758_c0_g1_i1:1578-4415(+)